MKLDFSTKKLFLAPLAGITNRAFRNVYTSLVDYKFTEMISAKGLFYKNKKTIKYVLDAKDEENLIFQIFGSEIKSLVYAAKFIEKHTKALAIDINMGCPVPKVYKNNGGSGLLKDPKLIYEITKNVKESISLPVSVKLRIGINKESINILETARAAELGGASFITVHGRTQKDGFKGKVDLQSIFKAKQSVKIPVIGNGDIKSLEDALEMIKVTGCDGVMVGRIAPTHPEVLYDIKRVFNKEFTLLPIDHEAFVKKHLQEIELLYTKNYQLVCGKKALIDGLRKFSGYKTLRQEIYTVKKYSELYNILKKAGENKKMDKIFDLHSDVLFDLYDHAKDDDRFLRVHKEPLFKGCVRGAIFNMYSETSFDLISACKLALSKIDKDFTQNFEIILGLEGLRNINRAKDIKHLYELGFRHAMITWNEENNFGTGAKANPVIGLKKEGKKLIKLMTKLGMIIDLSHTSEHLFWDIINIADKNLIVSHSNCRTLCPHPRNITDQQMQALKAKNGILGLTLAKSFLHPNPSKQTLDTLLDHLEHAIKIMGIDNVGFGFDFMNYLSDYEMQNPKELSTCADTKILFTKLRERGFSETDIEKITWKNFYERYKHLVWRKK